MRLSGMLTFVGALALAIGLNPARAAEFPTFRVQELDPNVGKVCYAVTMADVDGDGKPDVVAVTEDAVVWFANPCVEEAHDHPGRDRTGQRLHPAARHRRRRQGRLRPRGRVAADEHEDRRDAPVAPPPGGTPVPTSPGRSCRSAPSRPCTGSGSGKVLGNGKKQLIVAPLQGRGTKGPNWGEGYGCAGAGLQLPRRPGAGPLAERGGRRQLCTRSTTSRPSTSTATAATRSCSPRWEGVFVLDRDSRRALVEDPARHGQPGDRSRSRGRARSSSAGSPTAGRYIATIEPWHGFQVVVYTPPALASSTELWDRQVIDEPVQWGHAVWCADLDGDGDDELIIGQRDKSSDPNRQPRGPACPSTTRTHSGLDATGFTRHVIDDGGVGCEDALAADLDGDGRLDLIAGGRSTHNVRIYWNQGK